MNSSNIDLERTKAAIHKLVDDGRSKLKSYLLKKIGLATHDIRVLTNADSVFRLDGPPLMNNTFYTINKYYTNEEIFIVNASNTKPAILQIMLSATLPESCNFRFSGEEGEPITTFVKNVDYKKPPEKGDTFPVPLLSPGTVCFIKPRTFLPYIKCNDEAFSELLRDDELGHPPILNDEQKKLHESYKNELYSILERMEILLSVTLNNEELLPFEWSWEEKRFVQGFEYDGTVVI
ncbi:hypothetical protein [Planctobacterium marinum]|uniref:Uncharacterized protein n=1 Tax=Planctobacterium marinum TaxID=1631968 RepID=A0AA48HES6_9ALTE|nr:hypothetical protein MACH26_11540 [Planctobacterium marinum]